MCLFPHHADHQFIVTYSPFSTLTSSINSRLLIVILISVGAVVATAILVFVISWVMTRPLNRLQDKMQKGARLHV